MTSDDTLIFSGMRWSAARVVGREPMQFKFKTIEPTAPSWTSFDLAVGAGQGRMWSTKRPLAFWRTFAELDLNDEAGALGFVQRYGDPFFLLEEGNLETDTAGWGKLWGEFQSVAKAWDPIDGEGVSRISDDAKRLAEANHFCIRFLLPSIKDEVELVVDPGGAPALVMSPSKLRAFMVLSAASALRRKMGMRRCLNCDHWFELRRRDARYCSGSCQSLHHKQKG
jgi:hypothetical protein